MEEEPDAGVWDIGQDGEGQLRELYAIERSLDFSLWTSSAVFVAANAVLAIGFFQQEEHYLARLLISLMGLMIGAAWLVIVLRSWKYERLWIDKAKNLQKSLGVPQGFAVWDEKAPSGIPAAWALMVMVAGFIVFWSLGAAFGAIHALS